MVLPTPASRYHASATFVSSPDPTTRVPSSSSAPTAQRALFEFRPAEKTPSGWTLPRIMAASMRERALHALLDSQCGGVGFPMPFQYSITNTGLAILHLRNIRLITRRVSSAPHLFIAPMAKPALFEWRREHRLGGSCHGRIGTARMRELARLALLDSQCRVGAFRS
ncbi:hypothetical protein BJ912DRAFT_1059298 [Pholiota molesta]|nr:hypothetical protein BJ912DRAFT_1059298 [Pholiota molesta]